MFGIESAFTGRIGRDPELKMVKNGTMAMLMMSVLVDEAPPKEGQEAKPTWVNAKLFGDKAQAASESLKKGDSVYLEGRLTLDEWQGRQGEARHGLSLLPWHWARSAAASLRGNVNPLGRPITTGRLLDSTSGPPRPRRRSIAPWIKICPGENRSRQRCEMMATEGEERGNTFILSHILS